MSSGRTEPAPREARTDRTARRRSEPCATCSQALIGKTYNDGVEPPSHATEVPTGTTVVPQTSRAPPDQMRPTTPNMSRSGVPAIEPVRSSSRTWTPTDGERTVRSALRRYSTSSSEPRLLANPSPTGYTAGRIRPTCRPSGTSGRVRPAGTPAVDRHANGSCAIRPADRGSAARADVPATGEGGTEATPVVRVYGGSRTRP